MELQRSIARARGFSLVELMVALTLSLFLLGGMVAMFSSSKGAYETNSRLAIVQENGRIALETIARDIRGAGFNGCNRALTDKGTLDNVLLPNVPLDTQNDFEYGVTGHNYTTALAWTTSLADEDAPGAVANNDVIVVRTSMPGSTEFIETSMANATANVTIRPFPVGNSGPYLPNQILFVGSCEGASVFRISAYDAQTGVIEHAATHNTSPNLSSAGYGQGETVVRLRSTTYYLRCASNPCAAGERTGLWRRTFGVAEEIVEGIESLQFLYGITAPGGRDAVSYVTADAVTNWKDVVSVSIGLIAASVEESGSVTDNVVHMNLGASLAAANDRRIRKVFTSTVAMRNLAW